MFDNLKKFFAGEYVPADKSQKACIRESKRMRENLSEKQIDKTLKDSFPASDPPAWY